MPQILIVDDEPKIIRLVHDFLAAAGFGITTARSGDEALMRVRTEAPDLVILDLGLPGMDGLDVTRGIRRTGSLPIIMLTARDDETDKLIGLELGADDYVTKPFSPRELVARVRAVLRRTNGSGPGAGSSRLTFADLELDEDTREVWRGTEPIELTATEFKLLRYLMLNARRVLSKAQILDHVWQYDFGGDANVVESYVSYLRRKIDTTDPRLLQTLRGVGYVLRVPRE